MKDNSSTNATTIFAEQLKNVINLFEQWNDCERAVSLLAVLQRLNFPGTKFIQSVIETNLQQTYCLDQAKILERNANSAKYINSLSETYKNCKCNDVHLSKDSKFYESDRSIDKLDKFYDKKEEILLDLLKMMPILTIGNDDAKSAYLKFIPIIIDDATRRIVNGKLAQQISCYVLIHPAFTTDDRKSISEPLKNLEKHLNSSSSDLNLDLSPLSQQTVPSTPSSWQVVAPPQSKSTETLSWGSTHVLPTGYDNDNDSSTPWNERDDHHVSFSKNGEDVDFEDDTDKSNTQIGYNSLAMLIMMKERRKSCPNTNTLTTTKNCPTPKTPFQKQRSSSLTFSDSRRRSPSTLSDSRRMPFVGFDTVLDKHNPLPLSTHNQNVGMGNIGEWLKNLRLHKYTYLFTNKTYEDMMDFTDEYLIDEGVTVGATNKLVTCIQKLKKRYSILLQAETDLRENKIPISSVVDELKGIILTPMKPADKFNKHDVAIQFLKVLFLVSEMMAVKHVVPQDEAEVNTLLWILDKAVHSEAFARHDFTHKLNQYRCKMQGIKKLLPPKLSSGSHSNRTRSMRSYLQKKKSVCPSEPPSFISNFHPILGMIQFKK